MNWIPPVAFLLLLTLAPARAADAPGGLAVRERLARALDLVGMSPGDLSVRDARMWRLNEKRFRELGIMVGDFPLPAGRDALRPSLVDLALRSPVDALTLGLKLHAGMTPPILSGLVRGRAISLGGRPLSPIVDPSSLGHGQPSWVSTVNDLRRMIGTRLKAQELTGDLATMSRIMLDGVPAEEVGATRRAFDALASADCRPLLDLVLQIAHLANRDRAEKGVSPLLTPLRITTADGDIVIGTLGDDVYEQDAVFLFDPGGNDIYRNNAGGTSTPGEVAILIDLSGNDRYESKRPFTQGAAFRGVGALIDLGGDDVYIGDDFCQGAAVAGVGVLIDLDGVDSFTADQFAQGAAAFGYGVLIDGGGDDTYSVGRLGQGLGRTAGVGVLRDEGGDDVYRCEPRYESMYSQWTGGRKVHWSFAQGCGFGFYCRYSEPTDAGPDRLVMREMFPGGVGVLIDESGDDSYDGSMYAQGTAYFYGLGILLDRSGNDRYRATWYGQAAAPHYAAGILVDGAGDDEYVGMNQVQGNGRDFSTAVFLDLGGNDRYVAEDRAQGCGDLDDGYGIFIDFSGDDFYDAKKRSARGFATNRNPARQPTRTRPYRDVGVFLDLAGRDEYAGKARGADSSSWIQNATGRGLGEDD